MAITAIRNPVWGDTARSFIVCEVQLDKNPTWHPYAARSDDPEAAGQMLYLQLRMRGAAGPIGDYVAPAVVVAQTTSGMRKI